MIILAIILPCAKVLAKETSIIGVKVLPLPDERVRLILQFDKKLTKKPANFVMKDPAKLVFDFADVKKNMPDEFLNKLVRVGALERYTIVTTPKRMRAILSLKQVMPYTTDISGKQFNITITGNAALKRFEKRTSFYSNRNVRTRFKVEDVDYRGTKNEGGKLVIRMSNSHMDVDVAQHGSKIIAKFNNTRIPGKYLRRLDVSDFHTPAKIVDAYQRGKTAEFAIQTKGDFGHFAYQVNNKFYIEVFPLTEEEIKRAKLRKEVYTGKRISLNFQNIDVRSVLQLIADFTDQNIVISDKVVGKVTLHLNKVPWDQALSIIMKTRGLSKRKMGNVTLIAPSDEIAAREKAEIAALEQSKGLAPLLSELMQINYAKASEIAELLKNKNVSMLSDRGALSVDARTNSVWIQDTAAKLAEIKELVKKLDVPVKQVLIEARIVIVNKDFERDLGIRFGVTRPDSLSGTLAGANEVRASGSAESTKTVETRTGYPVPANRLNLDLAAPSTATPASIGLALAKLGNGILLDLELSALEIEGKGEVISSPRLITANQQEAIIESGEEIPYLEASSSGAATVSFKKAVLSLKVTPQITPDNKIILDLKVNQDTPGTLTVNNVPSITTKQIETNVLVSNGQTVVLGGIYKQDKKSAINRVPFLGEMPFIGSLFRNRQQITKREELLIFITPKIIKHSFMTS
jgi:type IV pilus assembly protein PilQ